MTGGKVTKVYEKTVKSYVYHCLGQGCKMQLPGERRASHSGASGLGRGGHAPAVCLTQPYLCLQLLVPDGAHFTVELIVADTDGGRHRLVLSTSFVSPKTTGLHAQIPLIGLPRGEWTTLAIHVADLVHAHCNGHALKHMEGLSLSAAFKLRRIFTTRRPPPEERPATAEGTTGGVAQWAQPWSPATAAVQAAIEEPLQRKDAFPGGVQAWCVVLDARRVANSNEGSAAGTYTASAYDDNNERGGSAHGGGDVGGDSLSAYAFGRRFPKPGSPRRRLDTGRGDRDRVSPANLFTSSRTRLDSSMVARRGADEDDQPRVSMTAPSSPRKLTRGLFSRQANSRAQTAAQPSGRGARPISPPNAYRATTARLAGRRERANGSLRRELLASVRGGGHDGREEWWWGSPERTGSSRMGDVADWRRHGAVSQVGVFEAERARSAYLSSNYAGEDPRERSSGVSLAAAPRNGSPKRAMHRTRESRPRQSPHARLGRQSVSVSPPRGAAFAHLANFGAGAEAGSAPQQHADDMSLVNLNMYARSGGSDASGWMESAASSRYGTPSSDVRAHPHAQAGTAVGGGEELYGFKVTPRVGRRDYRTSGLSTTAPDLEGFPSTTIPRDSEDVSPAYSPTASAAPWVVPPATLTPRQGHESPLAMSLQSSDATNSKDSSVENAPPVDARTGEPGLEPLDLGPVDVVDDSSGDHGQVQVESREEAGCEPGVPAGDTLQVSSAIDAADAALAASIAAAVADCELDDDVLMGADIEDHETPGSTGQETSQPRASLDQPSHEADPTPTPAPEAASALVSTMPEINSPPPEDAAALDAVADAGLESDFNDSARAECVEGPASFGSDHTLLEHEPDEYETTVFVAELDALATSPGARDAHRDYRDDSSYGRESSERLDDPRRWAAPSPVPASTLPSAVLHRALTPPLRLPDGEDGTLASEPSTLHSEPSSVTPGELRSRSRSRRASIDEYGDGGVDLVYDPILACYFDPRTNVYYELEEPS